MGALAASKDVKKGRDYATHAVDLVLSVVDDEDREWLLGQLANKDEITAPTLAEKIYETACPEYAPKLDKLYTINLAGRIRDWRNRKVNP